MMSARAHIASREDTEAYLKKNSDENQSRVDQFMAGRMPTAWAAATGLPRTSEMRREHHDSIAKLIDPAIVLDYAKEDVRRRA